MIAICCDASSRIGMGHLVRSRALAQSLQQRGVRSALYGPPLALRNPSDEALFVDWRERPQWTDATADGAAFAVFARDHGARRAVVDDYRADLSFQAELRSEGLDWLQQYDASRLPSFVGRLVVNASPYERAETYVARASHPAVRFLLGPAYAILREEFAHVMPRDPNGAPKRVFVCFGGGDDGGLMLRALSALRAAAPELAVTAVCGRGNPCVTDLMQEFASCSDGSATLHVDPPSMSALMSTCDLAVLAGGTITYEAARCGLPMLLVAIAENQYLQCLGWERLGAAVFLGRRSEMTNERLIAGFTALTTDFERIGRMSRVAAAAVDCKGVDRLINALLEDVPS